MRRAISNAISNRWLQWLLAVLVLAAVLHANRECLDRIDEVKFAFGWLLVAVVLRFGTLLITCVRWHVLMTRNGVDVSLRDSCRLGFLGNLSSYAAPGIVGGDLTRAILIAAGAKDRKTRAAATVLLDRALGVLALLILGAIAAIALQDHLGNRAVRTATLTVSAGAFVGIALLLFGGRLAAGIESLLSDAPIARRFKGLRYRVSECLALIQTRRRLLMVALLIGVAGQLLNVSAFYCCTRSLGPAVPEMSWGFHAAIVPCSEVAVSFVPVPGGIGAREGTVAFLFGRVFGPTPFATACTIALLAAFTYSATSLAVALIGGAVSLVLQRRPNTVQATEQHVRQLTSHTSHTSTV